MTETRTIRDPFLNKDVQISNVLTDKLRGKYACGPTLPSGEPEFGWREFETPPIQHQAADEIERLRTAITEACDLLAERIHGSDARSPGHNARLRLERALRSPQETAGS